jgi:hypothetical protein
LQVKTALGLHIGKEGDTVSTIIEDELVDLVEKTYSETDFISVLGKDLKSYTSIESLAGWVSISAFGSTIVLSLLSIFFQVPSHLTYILELSLLPVAYVVRMFHIRLLKRELSLFHRIVANSSGSTDHAWTLFLASMKLKIPMKLDINDLKYYVEIKEEKQNKYSDRINVYYAFSVSVITVPVCLDYFQEQIDANVFAWLFMLSLLVPSAIYVLSTFVSWKKIRTQNIVRWVRRLIADLERNPTRF